MERAFQHLQLNHSQIERACRQCFQNQGSLQSSEILSGGAVNTTFKICWEGKWYVLRFYVRDKNLGTIEKQIYQLVQATVPVPELLFASSADEVYPFAIFRFCTQPHIYEVDKKNTKKLSYDLGSSLAKIHAIHFSEAGLFGDDLSIETLFKEGTSPYFEYCLEFFHPESHAWKFLGDNKAQQVVHFIEKHQEYFPKMQEGGCLVHSDFKPVNLLWDETQGLTVIDWEFAHSGDGILDFAILLRHFQDFPLSISHLEKGYLENGGNLAEDWIQRARITDFINIVQLLNLPSERPKLCKSLVESLNFTMSHWEKLENSLLSVAP